MKQESSSQPPVLYKSDIWIMLRCSCFTITNSRRFLSNWQYYDDQVGDSKTVGFRYISRKRLGVSIKEKSIWTMTTDIVMFAQSSSISRSISFQRKIKTSRLEGLSFWPKVSECLCKNFFEANIICPKNLFDFSTKVQKCLWSCRMTLITSSKLTSKHPLCDIMSFF